VQGVVLAALAGLCALAWAYLLYLDAGMSSGTAAMAAYMPMTSAWSGADAVSMFVMWAVMMVAMMLPSVSPMVLLYARTSRHRASLGATGQSVPLFVSGYVLVWIAFSLVATLANWILHRTGLLSSSMGSASTGLAGALLILAGVYQWTPLKNACLAHCRAPVGFLTDHWREGRAGSVIMGAHHGAYCVVCCWLLMALLFVLGVMNLLWIGVLTLFVLLEQAGPRGPLLGRITGAGLILWGGWLVTFGLTNS
jgi:predicted metal-binding membrane protein